MSLREMPSVRLFLRLLVEPGWAPIVVLATFLAIGGPGLGERYDYIFHLTGGAAGAYFAWRCAKVVPALANRVKARSRPAFGFVVAIVAAVLWEGLEFLSDRFFGTSMQTNLGDTLSDLSYGAAGAIVFTVLARLWPSRDSD